MNVTDVDDKTIKGTLATYGPDATVDQLRNFTQTYFDSFISDLKEANILTDEIEFIRVTDKIKDIQQFIVDLVKKGYGYVTDDGIYFSIEKYQQDFGDYGQLVGEKFLEGKKIGARVAVDEYEKENLSDFALWKSYNKETDGNIFWEDSIKDDNVKIPNGRPGWHIECSVINRVAFNGEPTHIHTGGVDLAFPHHTNEIAQSQALLGKGNFVHHWFHSEHLLVDGKKMAKSAGNFYVLQGLESLATLAPWAFRYLTLQSHYRTQQNFTVDSLTAASNGVINLLNSVRDNPSQGGLKLDALEEDLNSAKAISENSHTAVLEKLIGVQLTDIDSEKLPDEVSQLAEKRVKAREEKDFAKSDELRKQIEGLGYEVLDTAEGQKIRKKL